MISVTPIRALHGSIRIPSSKPHCQRALILATLADGVSEIHHMNTCSETRVIAEACQAFGAGLRWQNEGLQIQGIGGQLHRPRRVLSVEGSGFALRNILAMASLVDGPTILTGYTSLGERPLQPLIGQLAELGVSIEPIEPHQALPLVNWGGGLMGGTVTLPVEATSQFASALLLVAPYASDTVVLRLQGEMVGREYISLSLAMMKEFGATAFAHEDLRAIEIHKGGYAARTITVGPDVTSLFCFIAAAVLVATDIEIEGVYPGTDALLDEAVAIGRTLGVQIDQTAQGVRILSGAAPGKRIELHVANVPTLVPALTTLACRLPHGMRITGAQHIQFHKTSRLETLMGELEKLHYSFKPIYKGGAVDGYEADFVADNHVYASPLDSHGDHRLFMALFLAGLPLAEPTKLLGEETLVASFPEFVDRFTALGAAGSRFEVPNSLSTKVGN